MTAAADKRPDDVELLETCTATCKQLKEQVARVVIGQEQVVDAMLITLLARGRGVPDLSCDLKVAVAPWAGSRPLVRERADHKMTTGAGEPSARC